MFANCEFDIPLILRSQRTAGKRAASAAIGGRSQGREWAVSSFAQKIGSLMVEICAVRCVDRVDDRIEPAEVLAKNLFRP